MSRPIRIRVEADEDAARLGVRDEGTTLTPHKQAHFFELFSPAGSEHPFGRVRPERFLARRIIEAMGGRIQLKNAPEKGTEFTVELPTMRMHLGRLIMTGSLLGTLVAPWLADWNASHLFSEQWSPHARFHGTVALFMLTGLSLFALWALWRRTADPVLAGLVGAAIPVLYWGSFFVAVWIPGTALEDPGHPVARPLGIPANVIAAGGQVLGSLIGLVMHLKMGVSRGRGAEPRTLPTE